MRSRRSLRPAVELMSARITPSNLIPYDNPVLAPITIRPEIQPTIDPLAPITIPIVPVSESFVGDGTPPAFGELPPVLYS